MRAHCDLHSDTDKCIYKSHAPEHRQMQTCTPIIVRMSIYTDEYIFKRTTLHYLYVELSLFFALSLALALFMDIQTSLWTVQNSPGLHCVVTAYVNLNRTKQAHKQINKAVNSIANKYNEQRFLVLSLRPPPLPRRFHANKIPLERPSHCSLPVTISKDTRFR